MRADKGHTLRVIARTCADEIAPRGIDSQRLAHGIERAAQLVGSHRRQILALEPDIGPETFGKMGVALEWRRREQIAQSACRGPGVVCEIIHPTGVPQPRARVQRQLRPLTLLLLRKPDIAAALVLHPTEPAHVRTQEGCSCLFRRS